MSETVGMIGLGNLGWPVAKALARSFDVRAYDLRYGPEDAGSIGMPILESVREVAELCDVAVLCLPSPEASTGTVRALAAEPATRIRVLIELSTIGIEAARECSSVALSAGMGYVDGPVSGGPQKAEAGELTVMAAGAERHLDEANDILEALSRHYFVVAPEPGLGQAMKLINNAINATSIAVTSEALAFGAGLGLDLPLMVDVLNVSTGRTTASEIKFPTAVIPSKYGTYARGEILLKDVDLYLASALGHSNSTVIEATRRVWAQFAESFPDTDVTYLYEHLR